MTPSWTVYLDSLGCRLNAAETETLARHFAGAGYSVVATPEEADLLVLNSCAVTAQAVRKSRRQIRSWHRSNPEAHIAILGCWATAEPEQIAQLGGVRWVLSNAEKHQAVAHITGTAAEPLPWEPGRWGHTRAFLAVQEGCDSHCTYCVTRILRGRAHSRPLPAVVAEVRELLGQGAQEVVLTGVSLGAYGRDDLGLEGGLAALVAALLRETEIPRLRLSSIEPWDVGPALLEQWHHPRLCRQLHLPLQSGSDTILRRMGRRTTTAEFAQLVAEARAIVPDLALTTDILVGFPGETEAEFAKSLAFVEEQNFARLHVFPYSERKGTAATCLPHPLPRQVKKERAARMRDLGARLAGAYRERFVGKSLPVLWERRNSAGRWQGWTDTYLPVVATSSDDLFNTITKTRLLRSERGRLVGEIAAVAAEPFTCRKRP